MQKNFAGAGLTVDEWAAFRLRFSGDTAAALAAARTRANTALNLALDGDPSLPIDSATVPHSQWPLNVAKAKRDELKAAVGIDAEQRRKYDEAQRQIGVDELTLKRLDDQIAQAQGRTRGEPLTSRTDAASTFRCSSSLSARSKFLPTCTRR